MCFIRFIFDASISQFPTQKTLPIPVLYHFFTILEVHSMESVNLWKNRITTSNIGLFCKHLVDQQRSWKLNASVVRCFGVRHIHVSLHQYWIEERKKRDFVSSNYTNHNHIIMSQTFKRGKTKHIPLQSVYCFTLTRWAVQMIFHAIFCR